MKSTQVTLDRLIKSPQNRAFLGKASSYAFVLFCLLPLALGLILPYFTGYNGSPGEQLVARIAHLIATGGTVAIVISLLACIAMPSRFLQIVFLSLLFPLSIVSLVTQAIMYTEFGTEIDERALGLFQGHLSALWPHAVEHYHIDWMIAAAALLSVALGILIGKFNLSLWNLSPWLGYGTAVLVVCSCALTLALETDISKADHFHPAKLAKAPVAQIVSLAGEQYLPSQHSGFRKVLERTGKMSESTDHGEIEKRLGIAPEKFLHQTVGHPEWLKRPPSHVFFFLLESMEQDLVIDPELQPLAPYLTRFYREGLAAPHFVAAAGNTIEAVHSIMAGAASQTRYPVPRALSLYELDTLPRIMERAHYTPVFYAASFRKFSSKGDSCEAYGFDRFVGCPDVAHDIPANDWGVNDHDFFQWTRSQLEDLDSPHFITFLNVSNHPPHDVDVEDLGEELTIAPESLERFVGHSEADKVGYARHVFYADKQVGDMAVWLKERYPDALFVFTGDHSGLRLKSDQLQRVPFILWNDNVIDSDVDTHQWFGSHMDTLASLASLVLPEGETYRTLGEPVWNNSPERTSSARDVLLTREGYFSRDGERTLAFSSVEDREFEWADSTPPDSIFRGSAIDALSWGYFNGKVLPGAALANR